LNWEGWTLVSLVADGVNAGIGLNSAASSAAEAVLVAVATAIRGIRKSAEGRAISRRAVITATT
jgi:hypothetical protein